MSWIWNEIGQFSLASAGNHHVVAMLSSNQKFLAALGLALLNTSIIAHENRLHQE
ncbi:uncharacterized protein PHALS_02613 [Plasmopara halstedii]|uniref:Uncharacterized protein n=1 Tax=Plasmopara halstedii TaxID=4781 RepID=A0A0P1AY90_PLAHL|nr:uncharacterized protein PHALS_02613 [Plasmopara halstedii]CEG46198.1 hypothetical protein PHALS_02613 [Plasmopara halstedii]|eukprot:XP_024582567.1 hypothetical protein PHALS_02613 [Plasmopara halstedii]